MTGGGLPGIYRMDQMHFHWASEHTIDSKRYTSLPTTQIIFLPPIGCFCCVFLPIFDFCFSPFILFHSIHAQLYLISFLVVH